MKKFLLTLTLLILSFPAHAQDGGEARISMIGLGSLTCQEWNDAEQNDLIKSVMVSWVYGYFSAMNRVRAVQDRRQYSLVNLTPSTIFKDLERFCINNPDLLVSFAVENMMGKSIKLRPRKQN